MHFAGVVKSTGSAYAIITTSHAKHYFSAPIQAIDRIKAGGTSERDLDRDWIEALGAYRIQLMLYYHVNTTTGGSSPMVGLSARSLCVSKGPTRQARAPGTSACATKDQKE